MSELSPNPNRGVEIPLPDSSLRLQPLEQVLSDISPRVIACSGGIDSLLLATVAHRQSRNTIVAHAISPAVPMEATARVKNWATQQGWKLRIVTTGEFQSEEYLSNPTNRCYYCKSNLYSSLEHLSATMTSGATLLSGANLDDLGEYRPGLIAASENGVRHPFIEANIDKAMIRAIARHLRLPFAELPASPCLASRLYTGTRVTPARLRAIEVGELLIRERTGIEVVRCRVREHEMFVEVGSENRQKISVPLLDAVRIAVQTHEPGITTVQLDPEPYRAGRAFVQALSIPSNP
jgi:uncharacterized protein